MSDLTSQDRMLIDRARPGDEPTNEDRARVRAALAARIGVGTGLVGTTAMTARAATAAVVWPKILATVLVTGAVGGAGVATYRASRPAPVHEVVVSNATAVTEAPARPAVVAPPAAKLEPLPDPINASPNLHEEERGSTSADSLAVVRPPSPRQPASLGNSGRIPGRALEARGATTAGDAPSTSAPSRPAPESFETPGASAPSSSDVSRSAPGSPADLGRAEPAAPAEPPPLAPTTLEAETRLVRAGVSALHAGDAARALALFDEHARAFPRGVLAEERAAERVVALGSLQRCDDARAAAAAFLTAHPASPLAPRVRAVCTAAPNR